MLPKFWGVSKVQFDVIQLQKLIEADEASVKTGPFGTQLKASEYTETGTPVINVRNVGFGAVREAKLEFIPPSVRDRLSGHLLAVDDIVFGRKGAVERHAFIRPEQSGWLQGSDCIRLRIERNARLIPHFVSYCFLTAAHKEWMEQQCSHGATMASLNQGIVERIQVPFPPLPIQRRIAGILSAYDDLIEVNTRRINALEEMARRTYEEWFVHYRFSGGDGTMPEGWKWFPFADVADFINGFAFKPIHKEEVGLPIVKIPELKNGITAKTPFNNGKEVPEKYHIDTSDLIFSWSGTLAVNAWTSGPALLNQHLFRVIPTANVGRGFIMFALRHSLDEMLRHAVGATMKHIRRSTLNETGIFLPIQASDQSEITMQFETWYTALNNLTIQNSNLRAQRDLLLPRLVSGAIDVSDAEQTLEAAE